MLEDDFPKPSGGSEAEATNACPDVLAPLAGEALRAVLLCAR